MVKNYPYVPLVDGCAFQIVDDEGRMVLRLFTDGRVEMGEHVEVTEVAERFWNAVHGVISEMEATELRSL